ncbi:MAG: DMT family transporter [Phycisphaerae bacterium]|nr:DMT family transporter [Phycisphaerae bacterium]
MSASLQQGHPSRAAGITLIVATLLSWAAVPLFLRVFREWGLDAFSSNGWRYGISAAFWLPFLYVTWRRGRLPASLLAAAIVPFLFNAVGQTFFAWVFYILDPGFGTFIFRVQIVFVTIGAWLLFPAERGTLRSPRYWIGVAGVVLGSVGLVVFSGQAPRGATAVGIAVALASGALFAGYGLAVRYYVSQYHPVTAFGVICQYTAGGVLAVMFAMQALQPAAFGKVDAALPLSFDLWQWFMLVASAFIGIAISHVLYYAALTRLGVAVSVGIIQLQPVLTATTSSLIGWDRLNAAQWASGLVGVVGAIVMLTARRRPETGPAELAAPLDVGEESEIAVHREPSSTSPPATPPPPR